MSCAHQILNNYMEARFAKSDMILVLVGLSVIMQCNKGMDGFALAFLPPVHKETDFVAVGSKFFSRLKESSDKWQILAFCLENKLFYPSNFSF